MKNAKECRWDLRVDASLCGQGGKTRKMSDVTRWRSSVFGASRDKLCIRDELRFSSRALVDVNKVEAVSWAYVVSVV
jgi:hypothetical protein